MRLADLLSGLSRLADLGFGLPIGTGLRSAVMSIRLAQEIDLPDDQARVALYTALLHHVGCVGYSHETARLLGDEFVANRAAARTDAASTSDALRTFLPGVVRGSPLRAKARLALTALIRGAGWGDAFTATACEVGRASTRRLRLGEEVEESIFHVYDVWRDHADRPGGRKAEIPVGARVARLCGLAVLFDSLGGPDLATRAVRQRAGGMLDPRLADLFSIHGEEWLSDLDRTDPHTTLLDEEPWPPLTTTDCRPIAELFGDLADLKSPYLLGHSRGVAALAGRAAEQLGLPTPVVHDVELAGHLHDVGRVAVSNAIWDKTQPLTADEWEQIRLHAYYSERILAGSDELARLVPLVGRHHERLDGTGYHRGSQAADLSMPARILAVADLYQTRSEPRPHRAAQPPELVEELLTAQARRGGLDPEATAAVLVAAGRQVRVTRRLPAGLSAREAEVLVLVARGLSNAEIAARLVISRRTAEHHVQHIYTKIGASSRAAAAIFAVEHRLVGPDG